MSFEARWIVSITASVLHAAECLVEGRVAGPGERTAQLAEPAARLADELEQLGVRSADFFGEAIPLAVHSDVPRQIVERTLMRLHGTAGERTAGLTRALAELLAVARPSASADVAELELRSGPLREQWESRGPGLLAMLRRRTDSAVVVEAADVILVQPVLGGGGTAHPRTNAVHLEAVLANPHAELPEIVRLGWLWGQLNLDLPVLAERIGRAELARVGPLALVPATLAAAQEVELARLDRATLSAAGLYWLGAEIPGDVLLEWWETYQAAPVEWGVALAALAHLLEAAN